MLKSFTRVAAFPLLLGGGTALVFVMQPLGLAVPVSATIVGVALYGVIWGLERYIPYRPEWNLRDGQFANDLGHTLFGSALGAGIGNALNTVWAGAVAAFVAAHTEGSGVWPTKWPLAVQVLLVFALADLGRWVQHRMHHAVPFLWRSHELHHSGSHLTAIKASRSHLIERVLQQLFMYGPLLALGAPAEALWWFIVPNSLMGPFSHCNADLELGPLEWVLMGPKNHRLHHSVDPRHHNKNFSSAMVLWDRVFGTWANPASAGAPTKVGLEGDPTPEGFFAQLVEPFRRRRRA
ncbi:MAG: sterol desaturase family protein [Myxococcaceae bacterium]|nr:sterol desaturase family protein [Myxococcaceae bacterium]